MTLKNYLILMSLTTAIIWGAFFFVISNIDPTATSTFGFILFYLSVFLGISGTAAILGFFVRFRVLKHEIVYNSVKIAFRQSFLLGFLATAILFLLAQNLFTWFNLILLIILVSVLEFFLIGSKK